MSIDVGDDVPHDIVGFSNFVFGPAETGEPTSRVLAAIATNATSPIIVLYFVSDAFRGVMVSFLHFRRINPAIGCFIRPSDRPTELVAQP
jgi:hypothetical protein